MRTDAKPRIRRIPSPSGVWIWGVFVRERIVAGYNSFGMLCRDLADRRRAMGRPW